MRAKRIPYSDATLSMVPHAFFTLDSNLPAVIESVLEVSLIALVLSANRFSWPFITSRANESQNSMTFSMGTSLALRIINLSGAHENHRQN